MTAVRHCPICGRFMRKELRYAEVIREQYGLKQCLIWHCRQCEHVRIEVPSSPPLESSESVTIRLSPGQSWETF